MAWTCLPSPVSQSLRGLGPCCRHRHPRACSGRLVLPRLDGERAHLKALARHGPRPWADQHSRRLRCAASGCTTTWRWGVADQALHACPPPAEGRLDLGGDRTLQGTRGSKHPVAHQPRISHDQPSVVGVRLVRLLAPWAVDRLPVACALVRRTDAPDDQPAPARFRQLRRDCRRPAWGPALVVTAAAADASRAHLALLPALG